MPSECEIICMWIDRLKNEVTWMMFDRHREPRLKLDCSPVYPGMTAGVCWISLLSGIITAHFCLNQKMNNLELNLSEQSVKEPISSLLLMIDSHHQH